MRKLRVTCPGDKLSFMQIGDIITDYEVITDNFNPPLIKVNTSNYAKDNKFEEDGRFMWWVSENFWIGFSFVTWESQKYYIIEDVLENCEIVED